MITTPVYASREELQRALDSKMSARNFAQLDRALESGARSIEGALHRRFYPVTTTRYFDWPNFQYARAWRLWLDQHDLISVTSFVSGGVTVPAADYFLRPDHGPPFTYVEIDLASSSALSSGDSPQRAIAITGVWGYSADTTPAGILAEALDDSETAVDVSNSALIGVGHIIKCESERMLVTDKTMLDTALDIHASDSLTASDADVSILMTGTTAAPVVDEVILIDSERMLVVDVAGSTLTVKRAWDGTVLATHAAGASIYAPRTLTVVRGALGTTAATHADTTAITRHLVPGLIRDLNIAEALNQLSQEGSGYARQVGSGENAREASGAGLESLREQARIAYGRRARVRAI